MTTWQVLLTLGGLAALPSAGWLAWRACRDAARIAAPAGSAAAARGAGGEDLRTLLDDALDSITEGFALFDADGRLVQCNGTYRRAYPLTADLMRPGARMSDILRAAARRGCFLRPGEDLDGWIASRLSRELASDRPVEHRLGDGRWYRISEQRTRHGGVVKLLSDVTERRRHEEALRQAQKMEAAGRLAGGMAHEFNNILTAIGGFAELARTRPDEPQWVAAALDEVCRGVRRAARLTRRMLAFSRAAPPDSRPVGVAQAVGGVVELIRSLLGETSELRLDLADDGAVLLVDPVELDQALINLALNARDAMPQGGTVTIASRLVELGEAFCRSHQGTRPGRYVALTLTDTGGGMDAETKAHAFEPFFTTKPQGEGSGLGLAMVYGFARQAGGMVTIDSTPGQGCAVTLYLPLDLPDAVPASAPVRAAASDPDGTILVVDDEAPVRDYVALTLLDLGYSVLRADSGAAALDLLDRERGGIDLLLTDVMMPGLTGTDLASLVAERHPEVKVIFMSGYENRRPAKARMVGGGQVCLFKPFTTEALARTVASAIATPTEEGASARIA